MEQVHQIVGTAGLQIPLQIVQGYGLQPGAEVLLELGTDEIRIRRAAPGQTEIENRALRYLLIHLGDAATVRAERDAGQSDWRVSVYGAGVAAPLGQLVFSGTGALVPERSTPVEQMRQQASGEP
jgi:antitoxin component of MazEF toxin-antitoxin module